MLVQGFAVADTTAKELGPFGDCYIEFAGLGQQVPQVGVMPAQFVAGAVSVLTDARPQPSHFHTKLGGSQVV